MTSPDTDPTDLATRAIRATIDDYIDGARTGRSDVMRRAFHADATVFGYIGDDLFAGPIARLFEWHDANGAATALRARVAAIERADSVATVRLEIENWTGHRFTDLFTLLRVDGSWRIMNKVFHLHGD